VDSPAARTFRSSGRPTVQTAAVRSPGFSGHAGNPCGLQALAIAGKPPAVQLGPFGHPQLPPWRTLPSATRVQKKEPVSLIAEGDGQIPGGDLLSQDLSSQYHRRCSVSLPGSEWDRVVPPRSGHQKPRFARKFQVRRIKCQSRQAIRSTRSVASNCLSSGCFQAAP
jgi:hypothetical protein